MMEIESGLKEIHGQKVREGGGRGGKGKSVIKNDNQKRNYKSIARDVKNKRNRSCKKGEQSRNSKICE